MTAALYDTNILIDLLNDDPRAWHEITLVDQPMISVMTWMEVMVGVILGYDRPTRILLAKFDRIAFDDAIMERAVAIRREHRIKLTDAIIWATAQTRDMLLVTRNTKDFPPGTLGVRVPYAA